MSALLQRLKSVLPSNQSQESNRQRSEVWQRWDTNSFSFLKISDIQQQLYQLLDLEVSSNFNLIVQKAFQAVKDNAESKTSLKQDYLEKRFFRLFIENLTKLYETLCIFQCFDTDKDNRISIQELKNIEKILERLMIDGAQYDKIYEMSTKNQLSLEEFIGWIDDNQIQNVCIATLL